MTHGVFMSIISLAPERDMPHIGIRWSPGPVVRIDTERGTFEAINPTPQYEDIQIQRALIERPAPRRVPWQFWWAAAAVATVAAALVFKH